MIINCDDHMRSSYTIIIYDHHIPERLEKAVILDVSEASKQGLSGFWLGGGARIQEFQGPGGGQQEGRTKQDLTRLLTPEGSADYIGPSIC